MIRNMWGKYVTVTGKIYRDPITGRPLEVCKLEGVEILQDEPPGSYKRARGAIPWKDGTELS